MSGGHFTLVQDVPGGNFGGGYFTLRSLSQIRQTIGMTDIGGGSVRYEVETSMGGRGIVVHEVNEVYIYIPAELSAAGFEIKIGGAVRITDKVKQ